MFSRKLTHVLHRPAYGECPASPFQPTGESKVGQTEVTCIKRDHGRHFSRTVRLHLRVKLCRFLFFCYLDHLRGHFPSKSTQKRKGLLLKSTAQQDIYVKEQITPLHPCA